MKTTSKRVALGAALCVLASAASVQAATFIVQTNGNGLSQAQLTRLAAAGGTVRANLPQIGLAVVDADAGFAARAAGISGLRSVTADIRMQFDVPDALVQDEGAPNFANPPNSGEDDTRFDLEWGMKAIDAAGAWNAGARGAGAVVAVLDSGIVCQHADIAPNLLPNSTSFVPGENVCHDIPGVFNHGTHVAGIIAAADNAFGTIGVAPQAKILAVKVLSGVTGSGEFAGIIQGIVYAADQGANVINMSLGVTDGLPKGGAETAELINATKRAVQYAQARNVLIVASAGNDARDLDHDANTVAFPAQLPGVLAVSATAPEAWGHDLNGANLDLPASYTNYGQSAVHFAGPGGDFDYAGNENCTIAGLVRPCWVFDGVFAPGGYTVPNGNLYFWASGTSMAAPHVSGVAALIFGKYPGIKAQKVEQILRKSADDLGKPGKDDFYGQGRVNAAKAVAN